MEENESENNGQPALRGFSGLGYVHFSVLAFGIAAISTSLGYIILPLRVLDVAPETLKNTYLSILTGIGMGFAMVVQPVVGYLSDKTTMVVGAAQALHSHRHAGGHRADDRRGRIG